MEKKNNGLVIMLVIIILGLGGYILYDKDVLGLKGEKKESNTAVTDNSIKNVEDKSSYNNLTKTSLDVYDSSDNYEKVKKLDLEIVNGELQAKLNYEKIEVKSIDGKVKSFLYQLAGCSFEDEINVIVLNDKNELFVADVNHYNQDNYLTFKKQNLNKEIVDITKLDYNYLFLTCGTNNVAVVTKDNKIYPYKYDFQNKTYSIEDLDITNFRKSISNSFIIYDDNTMSIFDVDGKYGDKYKEKVKYNGKELKIDKYYTVKNTDSSSLEEAGIAYIISDNKLYKLDLKYDMIKLEDVKISQISDKRIISESLSVEDEEYFINDIDNKITFEDYSTYELKNVTYVINLEQ